MAHPRRTFAARHVAARDAAVAVAAAASGDEDAAAGRPRRVTLFENDFFSISLPELDLNQLSVETSKRLGQVICVKEGIRMRLPKAEYKSPGFRRHRVPSNRMQASGEEKTRMKEKIAGKRRGDDARMAGEWECNCPGMRQQTDDRMQIQSSFTSFPDSHRNLTA